MEGLNINLNFKAGTRMLRTEPYTLRLALGTAEVAGKPLAKRQFIALVHAALKAGVTIFDTASNYQDGRSQEWLRDALITYCESVDVNFCLDRVLIVTKVGQLSNSEWQRRCLIDQAAPYYDFSIPFLEQQLSAASKIFRNVGQVMVLLHNPEDDTRFDHSDDLKGIAKVLESWVECGCFIGWGLSSWSGLLSCDSSPAKFQLSQLLSDAEGMRFRFFTAVQIPMGLWNSTQVFMPAQSLCPGNNYADVFEVSENCGIAVLVNSCFLGGERLPQNSINADERKLTPPDILKLCSDLVPAAIRVIGATQPHTIEASVKIFLEG